MHSKRTPVTSFSEQETKIITQHGQRIQTSMSLGYSSTVTNEGRNISLDSTSPTEEF
jgi:hypothetical protein